MYSTFWALACVAFLSRGAHGLVVLGIDMGSTLSLAIMRTGKRGAIEYIPDESGAKKIPFSLGFREGEALYGNSAEFILAGAPHNIVSNIWDTLVGCENPWEVSVDLLGKANPLLSYVSLFFKYTKGLVESYSSDTVDSCMITVLWHFLTFRSPLHFPGCIWILLCKQQR